MLGKISTKDMKYICLERDQAVGTRDQRETENLATLEEHVWLTEEDDGTAANGNVPRVVMEEIVSTAEEAPFLQDSKKQTFKLADINVYPCLQEISLKGHCVTNLLIL